ncbi:MAG TPA: PAS domain S-box protein [Steroidobacteraceae bacterium]
MLTKTKSSIQATFAESGFETADIVAAVFETMPECIKVVAQDGRLLKMNPAGLRMIDADCWDRVAGASAFELIAPEHRAFWLEQHLRVCSGEDLAWEFDVIGIKGTRRSMETHAVPIRSSDGSVAQLAVTRDITAKKNAAEQLRKLNSELERQVRRGSQELGSALARLTQTERGFGLLVESVTDYAIYMLDVGGHVVSWNAGARRIKGYEADEVIGRHFQMFYTKEDRAVDKPMRGLRTAAQEGRLETEGWRLRKDGTRFWANVIIDAIHSDNELVGYAKITRDITQRKADEEKLRHAQKMEAVGQFTGGAAHDFNNLLMAVLGSLEILRKRMPDDPKMLSLLDNAVQGAKRGTTLTQRMLAFARRQELKTETVELADLIKNVNDLMERSLPPAVSIELHFPPNPIYVRTDPNQLETALLNLVVNARDAMPDGGTITVSVRKEQTAASHRTGLEAGGYACLSVVDTGIGMDEDTLARATEPFFTTKGVGKGTGLGLSMVEGLAGQSGGKLMVQSLVGQGTTVEIWLPMASAAAVSDQNASDPSKSGEGQAKASLCVLAVDDDSLVLANVVAMLEDLGHEVISASSAFKALNAFDKNPGIDVLISDQVMPVMTGLQLIEALTVRRPTLAVILASGYAEFPVGVDARITRLAKPFTQQDLKAALTCVAKDLTRRAKG